MRIGVNGYEAVVPRFGFDKKTGLPNRAGSNEVCFQMLKNISILDNKNNYSIYLPINPTLDMPKVGENWKYVVFKSKKIQYDDNIKTVYFCKEWNSNYSLWQ